jgi:hypothetical protein
MGLKSEILESDDLVTKVVDVPVWKRKVTIREMGLAESLVAFGPENVTDDGKVHLSAETIAQVVACCVIDPKSGDRVFEDGDVPKLARKSRVALMFLYNEITALSGSVEEAGGN